MHILIGFGKSLECSSMYAEDKYSVLIGYIAFPKAEVFEGLIGEEAP